MFIDVDRGYHLAGKSGAVLRLLQAAGLVRTGPKIAGRWDRVVRVLGDREAFPQELTCDVGKTGIIAAGLSISHSESFSDELELAVAESGERVTVGFGEIPDGLIGVGHRDGGDRLFAKVLAAAIFGVPTGEIQLYRLTEGAPPTAVSAEGLLARYLLERVEAAALYAAAVSTASA